MAADSETIIRRNRSGTKGKDFYNWPDQDFNDMDTTLAGKVTQIMFISIVYVDFFRLHSLCSTTVYSTVDKEGLS